MPMPVTLFFNVKPSTAEEVDVESITDPETKLLAEKRNDMLLRMRKANELADQTNKEKDQAIQQFLVLDQIPTLTPAERTWNSDLTRAKLQKAMIIERRRRDINLDADIAVKRHEEAVAKTKLAEFQKCLKDLKDANSSN